MFPSVLPTSRFFLVSVRFFLIIEKRPSSWALECGISRTVFATLKSNYGRGLIARQRLGAFQLFLPLCPHILSSLLYAFRACAKSVRNPRLRVIAWPAIPMRENHAKCVTLGKSVSHIYIGPCNNQPYGCIYDYMQVYYRLKRVIVLACYICSLKQTIGNIF